MAFSMEDYFKSFNTMSEADFCKKFYTEDLQVESQFGTLPNRDAWLHALDDAHDGIREDLNPKTIVMDGDKAMVESIATFTATKDKPDFMHGPLKEGESRDVRFFTTYHFAGDRISRMAIAWWAPMLG
jgi:SnoaL-like domain